MLWYEFDVGGKFRNVKLLIKEKYPHTIITERYRFCCFKGVRTSFKLFQMKTISMDMKSLLQQIGYDTVENVDEETLDFVYDFVDKHGGEEQLHKELSAERKGKRNEIKLRKFSES